MRTITKYPFFYIIVFLLSLACSGSCTSTPVETAVITPTTPSIETAVSSTATPISTPSPIYTAIPTNTPIPTQTSTATTTTTPVRTASSTPSATATNSPSLTPVPSPNPVSQIGLSFEGSFNGETVVSLIYGTNWVDHVTTEEHIERRVEWELATLGIELYFLSDKESVMPEKALVSLFYSAPFTQFGQEKIFVVFDSVLPTDLCSFDCSTNLSSAIFVWENGRWVVEQFTPFLTSLASWRYRFNSGEWIQIGKEQYGYLLSETFIGTGFSEDEIRLLSLIDSQFHTILPTTSIGGRNNPCGGDEATPCWEFDSSIEFIPSDETTYFTLEITTTGTIGVNLSQIDNIQIFVFDGEMYNLIRND